MVHGSQRATCFDRDISRYQPREYRIVTAPGTSRWVTDSFDCGDVTVHLGSDGGPNILFGATASEEIRFWIQNCTSNDVVRINGQPMCRNTIGIIPPNQCYVLTARAHYRWMSLTISLHRLLSSRTNAGHLSPEAPAFVLRLGHEELQRLIRIAASIGDSRTAHYSERHADADLQRSLLVAIRAALPPGHDIAPRARLENCSGYLAIIERAVAFISTHEPDRHRVIDVSHAAGVSERTILRAFHNFFDMGPARYMRLRQLNRVHCALQKSSPHSSIRRTLISFKVTQFGRFAVEYKSLFGESPSQTKRRQPSRPLFNDTGQMVTSF